MTYDYEYEQTRTLTTISCTQAYGVILLHDYQI